MAYSDKISNILRDKGISIGDSIYIETEIGDFVGVLMPRIELGDRNSIIIKLDNGYNIGISWDKIKKIEKKGSKSNVKLQINEPNFPEELPEVVILHTGGTIASKVEYKTGAVYPSFTAAEIVQSVPELQKIAKIRGKVVSNIFSEDMSPEDWVYLSEQVYDYIKNGVNGVVITHGTDTMGYTAAALSFMIKNPTLPVVVVGAQRSSDRGSSDSAMNLISAVSVAANADFGEVCVVMHKEPSDTVCLIHPATRARKMHTSRRDAFRTINAVPYGVVDNTRITIFRKDIKRRGHGTPELKNRINPEVCLIKIHPGILPELITSLGDYYDGVVIEGTGLGHVPIHKVSSYSKPLFAAIKTLIDSDIPVAMTSQCIYGRINMNVYSTGRELQNLGVIPCEDMLPETALVKMMWVLGQTTNQKEVYRIMRTNIAGEISEGSEPMCFLR